MPSSAISDIISNLEFIAATEGSGVATLATIAISAVKASSSRALIEKARLGAMARLTVAATGLAPLNSYLAGENRTDTLDAAFRNVLQAALLLASRTPIRHAQTDTELDPPSYWDVTDQGYFVRSVEEVGDLSISHNPHMPGGDWTLSLSGIPLLYGSNPKHLADKSENLFDFMNPGLPISPESVRNPFRKYN